MYPIKGLMILLINLILFLKGGGENRFNDKQYNLKFLVNEKDRKFPAKTQR